MSIIVTASGQACGATVSNVNLCAPLDEGTVKAIRAAWLEHHVLSFPDQVMSDNDLERFTTYFGPYGDDPFLLSLLDHEHIVAVERRANETSTLFAESWHSDWSFQKSPPAGTCLFGITIPPIGGDTLFADQHKALEAIPTELRTKIDGMLSIHSAAGAYAPDGLYGTADEGSGRSMKVTVSADARSIYKHPLIQEHPESGKQGIFSCMGYIIGIDGMEQEDALGLLEELHQWQTRPEFQYRHKWQENNLVMWDNRSVLHRATGGYEGFDRLLHRTTIGRTE